MDLAARILVRALREAEIEALFWDGNRHEKVPLEIYDYAIAVNVHGCIEADTEAPEDDQDRAAEFIARHGRLGAVSFDTAAVLRRWPFGSIPERDTSYLPSVTPQHWRYRPPSTLKTVLERLHEKTWARQVERLEKDHAWVTLFVLADCYAKMFHAERKWDEVMFEAWQRLIFSIKQREFYKAGKCCILFVGVKERPFWMTRENFQRLPCDERTDPKFLIETYLARIMQRGVLRRFGNGSCSTTDCGYMACRGHCEQWPVEKNRITAGG
jgi:hypothetical protein